MRKWHRWIGLVASVFLIVTAFTGIWLECERFFGEEEALREKLRDMPATTKANDDLGTKLAKAQATIAAKAGEQPLDRVVLQLKGDADMRRVAQIPGVGLLTATAAIATMGQASAFKSGREFCAWLGLVPTQTGTGGKVRLGHISKRGDTYLRTLLIHGARSVLSHAKQPGPWLEGIKSRRPANVVIVAQAAKTARTIWAVTAKQQDYQRGHQSVRPQAA